MVPTEYPPLPGFPTEYAPPSAPHTSSLYVPVAGAVYPYDPLVEKFVT